MNSLYSFFHTEAVLTCGQFFYEEVFANLSPVLLGPILDIVQGEKMRLVKMGKADWNLAEL